MDGTKRFEDRKEAGQELAAAVEARIKGHRHTIVVALPRGGVPIGYEVALRLNAPLDVLVVRKVGLPGEPEYAIGAIASGNVQLLNDALIKTLGIPSRDVASIIEAEQAELIRREARYRGERATLQVQDRTVVLVDDGMATGYTMQAALRALRQQAPAYLLVAVPVASAEACDQIQQLADEVICLSTPSPFRAVGLWYRRFSQTSDEEVQTLLASRTGDD